MPHQARSLQPFTPADSAAPRLIRAAVDRRAATSAPQHTVAGMASSSARRRRRGDSGANLQPPALCWP